MTDEKLKIGILDMDATMESCFSGMDASFWECPHCGCEHELEVDASGEMECHSCGKLFRVYPVV